MSESTIFGVECVKFNVVVKIELRADDIDYVGTRVETHIHRDRDFLGGKPILKSPNFFIVGAPKCGTTALHTYLQGHPDIYLPRIKEPHFYLTDVEGYPRISSRSEYNALFRGANEQHMAVGESSVFYLYSREAVPNIGLTQEKWARGKAKYA